MLAPDARPADNGSATCVLRLHRQSFVRFVVAAAGVCTLSCGRQPEPTPPPTTVIRIGIGAPPKGTPGTGLRSVVMLLSGEPWLTNKPDGHQSDRIATSWEWDASATTLRLKLRKDVYFHDGERLTPEIATAVLQNSIKAGGDNFTSVTSVRPVSDDTVAITLSKPNAFFLTELSSVTVIKPGTTNVGTGPFQVVSTTDQDAKLTAFPKYYRGTPGLTGIEIVNYPTQRNAWTALMRGEIDMLHEVSSEAIAFVTAQKNLKTYSFPRPYYIAIVFNMSDPVLKNIEVRRAINEALDREALVQDGMRNRGRPADGPVLSDLWLHSPSAPKFTFDQESAKRRLDAAGLKTKLRADGTSQPRLSITCLVFAEDARFERLALLAQKQLADVGIDMKLQPIAQTDLTSRAGKGEFQSFIFEFAGRSLNRVYDFWSGTGLVKSGYKSTDAIFERIKSSRSDDETRAAVAELERILHSDPPAAFLVWQETTRAVSSKFDVMPEKNRDILASVWQWRPATVAQQTSR